MNWVPNRVFCHPDEWYEQLFDDCKTRADVVEKATELIKRRDRDAYDKFHLTIDMIHGHRAALEIIKEMEY